MEGGSVLLSREKFIRISLEVNLFFQRIMKEHLFFIEASLPPVEADNIVEADILKRSFEELLMETVSLANGAISKSILESNELVTPYTFKAEKINSILTGSSLNTDITKAELALTSDPHFEYNELLESRVSNMNHRSLNLLGEVIKFQKKLMNLVLECKAFSHLYPKMMEHDTREAELYYEILKCLEKKTLPKKNLCEELNFWNNIMGEHAQFIDGMLDPSEKKLKMTGEKFAKVFEKLVEECIRSSEKHILEKSLKTTESIKDFKKTSTQGILECEIKSIIPPLLADHVLREANHYLRLLKTIYN